MKLRVLAATVLAGSALPLFAGSYIVEFRTEKVASAAGARTAVERLRDDLARIDGPTIAATREASRPRIRREFTRLFDGAAVELPRASSIRRLLALPYVANVHLDREVSAGATTEVVNGRAASAATHTGGKGVVVAVIDSGVDYTHPALGGGLGPGRKVLGGWDFVNDDADPMDDNRHGTHVAGIIAASSAEITGVAPEASLLAYKVLDANGKGSQSDVIAALERAVDPDGDGDSSDRAHVINLSLGSPGHPDDPVANAVDRATALGVVVIASVGNSGEEHAIMSPALARTALAVGTVDGGREVAEFSARGPAAQSEVPRPDVLAPGVSIRSTALGGGTLALSGTSMSAPYVAAVAARLIEQHPEWTPERVRSAIVYSGYPIPGTSVLAQGTGPVDIPTAFSSQVFIQPNPLAFGVMQRGAATWRARRTIRLRSEYDVPVTMRAEAPAVPAGVKFTFVPETLQLQPGVEAQMAVDIEVDVAVADAQHEGLAFGGWVKLVRGAVDAWVPWAVIRAARVRTTVPYEFPSIVWSSSRPAAGSIAALDPYTVETLLEPAAYDFAVVGASDGDVGVVVRENVVVDGDLRLDVNVAEARHEVRWEAVDPSGGALARTRSDTSLYTMAGRLLFADGDRKWSIELPAQPSSIRSSSFGPRWSLLLTETAIDTASRRIVVAQHAPVVALDRDAVLRNTRVDYASQEVELLFPDDAPERNVWLLPRNVTRRSIEAGRRPDGLGIANAGERWSATVWMTPEVHPDYASGVQIALYTGDPAMLETSSLIAPMIRRRGASFVSTFDFEPAALPLDAIEGETLVWGNGAIWPASELSIGRTSEGRLSWSGTVGVTGTRNDRRRRETAKAAWRVVGDDGQPYGGGVLGLGAFSAPASTAKKLEVLVASPATSSFPAAAGLLELTAGNAERDAAPPTLTSLAILDSQGRHARRVGRGSAARLVFSAADLEPVGSDRLYRSIDPARAKVSVRPHAGGAWVELPSRALFEDAGSAELLGRTPAGHVFETALGAVPFAGFADLRIEVADRDGSTSTWTLSPAFRVDEAGRTRAVRR